MEKAGKGGQEDTGAPIEETTDEALSRDIMDAPVLRGLTRMHEEARDALRAKLEIKLRTLWPESSLCIFGSSGSSLGSRTCDLDMTIVFASAAEADEGEDLNPASETVAHIEKLLRDENDAHEDVRWKDLEAITTARVPIVHFVDSNTGLQCDICQDNVFALRNTKLLRAYCDISKSARALIFTVKLWAKSKGISDASRGSLSSYAWVLLAIFYLQNVDPPILPVLQDVVLAEAAGGELSGNKPCRFVEDVIVAREMLRISREGSDFLDEEEFTVAHLLKGFFEFYAYTFDRYTDVVCIRKGNAYRKGKGKCKWKISIEDPLSLIMTWAPRLQIRLHKRQFGMN